VVNCTRMFTSALRADQYLDVQIKCVVGALNLLESQLATALVAVRRGWWLNKGTHERLTYSLTNSCGNAPVLGDGASLPSRLAPHSTLSHRSRLGAPAPQHERDALTREAAFGNAAMAIYGPEYRPL